jgi:hypothetical protein
LPKRVSASSFGLILRLPKRLGAATEKKLPCVLEGTPCGTPNNTRNARSAAQTRTPSASQLKCQNPSQLQLAQIETDTRPVCYTKPCSAGRKFLCQAISPSPHSVDD